VEPAAATASSPGPARIAIAGNPNTGKTSLFNRLTGSNARVGNYAGVTVERELGRWRVDGEEVEVLDIPGTYSLAARSAEEQVAVRAIFGMDGERRPLLVVVCVDSTQLVRNLYLVGQLVEAGIPVVVALNLVDVARAQGAVPDAARVSEAFGVPAVLVSAQTGEGLDHLGTVVAACLREPRRGRVPWTYPAGATADIDAVLPFIDAASPEEARALAIWALLSVDDADELVGIPPAVRKAVLTRRRAAEAARRDLDGEIVGTRYRWLDGLRLAPARAPARTLTDRADAWLLHPVAGTVTFILVMGLLFQALFSWSDPAISAIEALFGWTGALAAGVLPPGWLSDLVVDGVINGFGSVLVFLPQILLLFFALGFLEDSGYMARVAYLVDRGMKSLGLHGRAFVPMLSGYACAVPAIMATRTLERRRDRLLTMLVVPLMSCSARLPVYTLIIAALFPASLGVQGGMMVFMYVFSTGMALVAAAVLGRTVLKGPKVPFLLELPPYRMPRPVTVLRQMWLRASMFVTEAGKVILLCTIVLWALLYFPRLDRPDLSPELASATQMEESYGGRLGRSLEPVIAPLGFDWKIGIGLVGAFAAREVFVSTMGVVYGVGEEAEETSTSLRERIRNERRPDGSPRYTPLVGLSLMVFFALSAQCMSTLAVVRRESGSWSWAGFLFAYMTVLAWLASFAVYQGGRLLGYS
jgi:ferrous iron transport protein B